MTVTLFASIINFFVDYIFIDILSAPTADAFKVSSQESAITKAVRRVSNVNLAQTKSESKSATTRLHSIPLAKSKSVKDLLLSQTETRIVPSGLAHAHMSATETFHDVMGDTKEEVEKGCSARQSLRLHRLSGIRNRESFVGGGKTLLNSVRPPSPTKMSARTTSQENPSPLVTLGGVESLTVDLDHLYETLKEEILEERSLIRRPVDKETFDALWG